MDATLEKEKKGSVRREAKRRWESPLLRTCLEFSFLFFWEGLERGKMDVQKTKGRE